MDSVQLSSPLTYSVVIPVWNGAAFVLDAIQSAEQQSRRPEEILVVDDCSTDDTAAVVQARARESAIPIQYLRTERNGGASQARNMGAAAATSPWIAFLDADDTWAPGKAEKQLAIVEADPDVALVGCGYVIERDNSSIRILNKSPDLLALAKANLIGTCSNAMVRAEAFAKVGGFDETLATHEDWVLFVALAATGSVAIVPEFLVSYRSAADRGQRLSKNPEKTLASAVQATAKIAGIVGPAMAERVRSANELTLAFKLLEDFGDAPRGLAWWARAVGHARSGADLYAAAVFFPKYARFRLSYR